MSELSAQPRRRGRVVGLVVFYVAYLLAQLVQSALMVVSNPYHYGQSSAQRWINFEYAAIWGIHFAVVALVGNALVFTWSLRRLPRLRVRYIVVLQMVAGTAAVGLAQLLAPSLLVSLLVLPPAVTAVLYGILLAAMRRRYGRSTS